MRSAANRKMSGAGLARGTSVALNKRPSNSGISFVAPSVMRILSWPPLDAMQNGIVSDSSTSRMPATGSTRSRSTRSRSAV
jgi:hypothetical protein